MENNAQPTVQSAMSALLAALGFDAMASDVLTETDRNRLARYARIIVKQSPQSKRAELISNFRTLRVIA